MKIRLILALFFALTTTICHAQTQTFPGQVKIKNVPLGSKNDSLMVLGSDGTVRRFPQSEFKSGVISVNGKLGAVLLNSGDLNLDNVDNTNDSNKPVSTAQAAAINAKVQNNLTPSTTVAPSATAVNTALSNKGDLQTANTWFSSNTFYGTNTFSNSTFTNTTYVRALLYATDFRCANAISANGVQLPILNHNNVPNPYVSANYYTTLTNAANNVTAVGLPQASTLTGRIFVIKRTNSDSVYNTIIEPYDSELIDGLSTYSFNNANGAVTIQSTGTTWIIIGKY
ncbi:hypothetical protein [Pedobacter cryoconitis]|uniref:T9SS C-terminal target domain-containing protein n=1 Tax=Pedobacter cryoconitis TaxID=188932 RepID=A0A7X0J1S5_9SPHI|nr:hypothetical protein [Pedobacter cryoconitis]MBB6499104.1 hypothetical protein [Pedobacter cryoconitis]